MGGRLLQASWPVRVIAVCAIGVLGADVAAVVNGLAPETAEAATPAAVAAAGDDVTQTSATALPGSPVVIVGAYGTTTQVDPSTPEGQAAIAAATERGDTLLTVVPDEDGNLALVPTTPDAISDAVDAANDLVPGVTVPVNSDIVDAVQHLIDEDPDVIADQVDAIVAATSTTIAAGGGATSPTTAAGSSDGPGLTLPEVTIPDITVTLPPVTVSIPPVTLPLVSTTITVPVTLTLPPVSVTVTIPPVTLPTTSTTTPPTSITIPVVTTVSSILQSVLTTLPVTIPTVTIPPVTLPHL